MFRVEGIAPLPLRTAISDFISAASFGLVQAYALQKLTEEAGVNRAMAPAMKPLESHDDEDKLP
jgi:hypothetical protein